uniref:C6 domain-containing protein n=1 Tax=Elaeophora elaphi TaxID=1147741 RepID=A0A0R3RX48_9BILA
MQGLNACGPFISEFAEHYPAACRNCKPFETNVQKRNSFNLSVENVIVSYGVNSDGCKFATLQCSNPAAKDILIEWYDPLGASLGITGPVKYTQKVISLITCNQNSEWTYSENGKAEVIKSATCEYVR